jgi:hypothetical protein
VEWIEGKLAENGIKKIVPPKETLLDLYRLAIETKIAEASLADVKERARATAQAITMPSELDEQVKRYLEDNPEESWDEAIMAIAPADFSGGSAI